MGSLRQTDGLSGFTRRAESEYDAFGAGHSSTSISAGLGMVENSAAKCISLLVMMAFAHPNRGVGLLVNSLKLPLTTLFPVAVMVYL